MKEKILMPLIMISFICLSAFTPSKELNLASSAAVKKTNPSVTVTYPSEFTRFITLQLKKAEISANKNVKHAGPYFNYFWWDFNGSQINQNDPYYYSLDSDNLPECTNLTGNTYCEVRAQPSTLDDTVPSLSTINATRYRPLQ